MNFLTINSQAAPAAANQKSLLAVLGDLAKRFIVLLRSTRIQRRERRMQLVERIAVGNKQHVVLLKIDGKEIVVGCSPDSLVFLGQSEQKQLVAQPAPLSADDIQSKFNPPATESAPRTNRKARRKTASPSRKPEERKASMPTEAKLTGPAVAKAAQLEKEQLPELRPPVRAKKTSRPKLVKPVARKQRQPVSPGAGLLNSIHGKAWIHGTDRRVQ